VAGNEVATCPDEHTVRLVRISGERLYGPSNAIQSFVTSVGASGAGGSAGVVETLRTIASEEGVAALYAGVTPKVVRALLSGAIQFSTYEATKDWAEGFLGRNFPRL